jgi:L-fuconolactonase
VTEQALGPDVEICDPHHHLWNHPQSVYEIGELRADAGAGHRVTSTVFVECGSAYRADGPEVLRPVGETPYVVAQADGLIRGVVGFADLTHPDVGTALDAHVELGDGLFRGIRHVSAYDASDEVRASHTNPPPGLLGEDSFRRGFAELARRELRFDAWLYHPQLGELAALARAFPDVTIILDHLGGPLGIGPYAGRRDEVLASWRASMAEVASCSNVVLKLGGIGMPIFGLGFHKQDGGATSEQLAGAWGEPIRWCIEAFGVDRCMFESNFPVDRASCDYVTLWNAFKRIAADASASDAELRALFHDTAHRTYGLG